MHQDPEYAPLSPDELKKALASESKAFEDAYRWLEAHMPPSFLDAVNQETRILIARNLLSFCLQDQFSPIYFKHKIIVLCTDGPDADLKIFKKYKNYVIRYYRAFVSNAPPPCAAQGNLRIALLYFEDLSKTEPLPAEKKKELFAAAREHNPDLKDEEIETLVQNLTPNFLKSMAGERLALALEMFFRAKSREQCQYELRRNEKGDPPLQLVMAWRNVPKAGFLYRLAKVIHTHDLALQKVVGTYIDLSSTETILILSLGLHGPDTDIPDFLREFALIKYFDTEDRVEEVFVEKKLIRGNEAHLVRNMAAFIHQVLVYADPNLYSHDNIIEGLCRHPELTVQLVKSFAAKFDPEKNDLARYENLKKEFSLLVEKLDTGQAIFDIRRKNILRQALSFIDHTLKTNFYRQNKSAFAFRLDPKYLDNVPFERKEKFPELPFGIFFIRGMHFIGFNIRFKDLARGGVRTVMPEKMEQYFQERNTLFSETYNLGLTQQKKNKDIPEGGAKTVILLRPCEDADLHAAQSSFIDAFLSLINCEENGTLRAKSIVDYWQKPEYIYLGPDENMSPSMIVWISQYAALHKYKPGRSFMSSKPGAGINHKEFGITSYGINVYLHQVLLFLGIDPKKEPFTVKISGGPDGDVAGNEILNLYKYYPKTASLLALTDVSGTIYDPKGLDFEELSKLFHKELPIRHYPPEKLSEGGFLLDIKTRREESAYAATTLCWKNRQGKIVQEWLSGSEMNHLYRNNLHQVKTDVFIPGGGRPRTLNEESYQSFLDETGRPTSRAIVEGANLYLTPGARRALEKLGVIIIKDSSCNKGGVICSSFEVLLGLCMEEEEFIKEKPKYVKEVLEIIGKACLNEANLLLNTHRQTGAFLTDISDAISQKINLFKYQLLDYLVTIDLPKDPKHPLMNCLLQYCPPLLRTLHLKEILSIPEIHKKAIISCYLASHLVYQRGIDWNPSIADVLPMMAKDI